MKWIFIFLSLPLYAQSIQTNVLEFKNALPQETARVSRSLELIEEVVSSAEFRNRVLDMRFKVGRWTYTGYSQTDLSPAEVLASIYSGRENFPGGSDGVMDLYLHMYEDDSATIGYTSPTDKFIHMNRFHHDDFTAVETSGNLFHEWLHKLDHDHYGTRFNPYRKHSVPYKIGNVVRDMVADIVSEGDPLRKSILLGSAELDCHHEAGSGLSR